LHPISRRHWSSYVFSSYLIFVLEFFKNKDVPRPLPQTVRTLPLDSTALLVDALLTGALLAAAACVRGAFFALEVSRPFWSAHCVWEVGSVADGETPDEPTE